MDGSVGVSDAVDLGADEFKALFEEVRAWGRWDAEDERGALNNLEPEHVAAAARLVRSGVTVSLSWPLNTRGAPHNPEPADHHMTAYGSASALGAMRVARDYVGVGYHADTHTHLDALCHIAFEGLLYNGTPAEVVTAAGATAETIEVLRDGLVGRGVLLDVPGARGLPWLEPGEHVFRDDLERAAAGQGVDVGRGDILLVRTGHSRRLGELGPWDTASAKAGLHPTAMRFAAERKIAALGCDGNSDTAPSTTEGVAFPVHVLAITAMGVHLLDYLRLEDLVAACEREARWEFLFVGAPLRIEGGTGSPLNPIAVF